MSRRAGAYDVLRPDPAGTIQSLSALGYSTEAAIADLVDNSIAAGARQVDVVLHWGGAEDSWVSVRDDGRGMDEDALMRGLTLGASGTDARRDDDLGRFGMGLKTASFSQAREVVVASRPTGGAWSVRTWDVDHVLEAREWQLLHGAGAHAHVRLRDLTDAWHRTGTVVLWQRLTGLTAAGSTAGDEWAQAEFYARARTVETHLGMVFARYIFRRRDALRLTLNGNDVQAWDPFLGANRWVETLPAEEPAPGVVVRGFVMPHRSRLNDSEYERAGGPRGWLDQQGFYVYRRDRLIVAGDWLGLGFRKDDRHSLARVAVTVPATDDAAWSLDVRKSRAMPPAALRAPLKRIARATRARAEAVVNHKGKVIRDGQTTSGDATWRAFTQHGRTSFRINRDHPLLRDLSDRVPAARGTLQAFLRMVEDTLPVGLIRVTPADETTVTFSGGATPDEVLDMARRVLEACINRGDPPATALQRVERMPPFDGYPTIGRDLMGRSREPDDPS